MYDFWQTNWVIGKTNRLETGVGRCVVTALSLWALAGIAGATSSADANATNVQSLAVHPDEPIKPLPQTVAGLDPKQVLLGERLFHDPRLSGDLTISCANCHPIPSAGADGRQVSTGVGGRTGTVNSPTVFNSDYNVAQFWDGRAVDLEQQIDGPVHHPDEMDSDWPTVIARLSQDDALSAGFNEVYGRPWDAAGIKAAIVSYERSLITANSPFDRYLRGEAALSPVQRQGYALFKSYGCIACHQGVNVGGNMYAPLGSIVSFYVDGKAPSQADLGRFKVTGDPKDKYVFKVPSLRLVARTAPYLHDGSVSTLEQAIILMGHHQLGREIPAVDVLAIIAFLEALEGSYQRLSP